MKRDVGFIHEWCDLCVCVCVCEREKGRRVIHIAVNVCAQLYA